MRRWMLWVGVIATAVLVAAFGYGCGEMSAGTCADNGTCAGDASAGGNDGTTDVATPPDTTDTGADAPVTMVRDDAGDGGVSRVDASEAGPGTCDTTMEPKDEPCLLDGVFGVFVSGTTGHDSAIGTKADPLKTIAEGIAKAAQNGKARVYVCNGSYAEQVSLDAQHDGIGLYGGFDCANGWAWEADGGVAQVVGPSALYALRVDSTTKAIAIEDMSFTVPDATGHDGTGAGNSSIAAFVSNESAGVTFRRVGLHAGAGVAGSDGGVPATNWFSASAADLQGSSADGGAGGAAKDCRCKSVGDTQGGAGGAAGDPGGDGGQGTATPLPGQQVRNGGGGAGYNDTSQGCSGGRPGADGSPQADGGAGAAIGALGSSGWVPGSGLDGLPAYPGQGGGGGGGGQIGGSGGGGCGGCGGAGGPAGRGGGASVALLVLNATVVLGESRLMSAAGGIGGNGSTGEGGASGGGSGNGIGGGCPGGAGGSGAGGQGGGGGAGGVSVGILSSATSHSTVDGQTTFVLGTPGAGGSAGTGGMGGSVSTDHAASGVAGTKGADGVAQPTLSR